MSGSGNSEIMLHLRFHFPLILAAILLASSAAQSAVTPPNIVFFFVDDMGWQETSVPFHSETTELNRRYHTPHMEALAAEGMAFTQAYACAICSPSRVSLMTGQNAARHRVTCWTLRKNASPEKPGKGLLPTEWNVNGLSSDPETPKAVHAPTLPALLRSAGYRTIHAGKAHFGAKGTPGEDPLALGFDINIGGHAAGGPGSYWGEKNYSAAWRNGDRIWDVPGLEKYHGTETYLTEATTLESITAVENAVADGKPFYLYLSHYAVHAPFEEDRRFHQKYLDQGLSKFDAMRASMIESMDKSLGDIRAALERLKVAENTIVVFMSDNGAPKNCAQNLPLRGYKISAYEGGSRVPLIVKWPSVTKAGSRNDTPMIVEDIFPTFLEMAGLDLPTETPIDGISFTPLLKGGSAEKGRALYWHYPNLYYLPPFSSIRVGDWKLIYFHADSKFELYHLVDDIGEKKNLAAQNPERVAALAKQLTQHLKSVDAQMPIVEKTGQPVPWPDPDL